MTNKQSQKAGDNAQQIQGNIINVYNGIDEKKAREIYHEMNVQSLKDYADEAHFIAKLRVEEFENKLLPKMNAVEGALEAFADPSFQILLVEAQKTAASTERPADYELLSELLLHRFMKGGNRVTRAGISRAVEIVDKISDDALLGLTVFHSVGFFTPLTGNIQRGLVILNDLFGKLFYGSLPVDNEWLDHLDILDTIRLNSLMSLNKIELIYTELLYGYVDVGIEMDSGDYKKAIELLDKNGLSSDIMVEHELNQKYARLNIPKKEIIEQLTLEQVSNNDGRSVHVINQLTEGQKNAIKNIYDLYNTDANIRQQNVVRFMEEWNKQPNLKKLREWWDNIEYAFQLTSVGKVLAHSNAQRCDNNLPPFK